MQTLAANPSFAIYALSIVVLSLNVLGLWGYSGGVRAKTKTTMNPEDARTTAKGADVVAADPPEVARVLRAHRNAVDNILPFALIGFLFVAFGGSPLMTAIFCGTFTAFRLVHSLSYLAAKQPWRTLSFVVSSAATVVMTGLLVRTLIGVQGCRCSALARRAARCISRVGTSAGG